jgi:hypothetical protein
VKSAHRCRCSVRGLGERNASFCGRTSIACPSCFSLDARDATAQLAASCAGTFAAYNAKIMEAYWWDTFRRKRLRMGGKF